jgi:arylformamidase
MIMSEFIDITVGIEEGLAVFPGDPPVEINYIKSIKEGDLSNVTQICASVHTGTHIDAPYHFFQNGMKIEDIDLEKLMGPIEVVLIRNTSIITREILEKTNLGEFKRVIFKTDHSYLLDRFTRFRKDFVHFSVDACGYLVEKAVRFVGIDSFSIESYESKDFMGHKILLGAGIPVLEVLDLKGVSPGSYEMLCLPMRVDTGDAAPARVLLKTLK